MICKPCEIVGIPFPFSDRATQKRRPVLVITCPDHLVRTVTKNSRTLKFTNQGFDYLFIANTGPE
jgi:hypothetical protein